MTVRESSSGEAKGAEKVATCQDLRVNTPGRYRIVCSSEGGSYSTARD